MINHQGEVDEEPDEESDARVLEILVNHHEKDAKARDRPLHEDEKEVALVDHPLRDGIDLAAALLQVDEGRDRIDDCEEKEEQQEDGQPPGVNVDISSVCGL